MNNEQMVVTTDRALVFLDNARHEIQSASDILTLKVIHDKLSAMKVYFQAAKASFEISQRCSELKIRCERKAGELLGNMDLNEGGRPSKTGDIMSSVSPPKLADLDISKKQSSRWQQISKIPEKDFDNHIERIKIKGEELTSREFLSLAEQIKKDREQLERREKSALDATLVQPDDKIKVLHGDFRDVLTEEIIPNDSVSLLLTDPMYGAQYLPLWEDLGKFASRVLKPGRLLVAYDGQMFFPQICKALEKNLIYVWLGGIKYSHPNMIIPLKIKTSLKLLLLFSKGKYDAESSPRWFNDFIQGDPYRETKILSELQQGLHEAEYIIKTFTNPGDLVADCFVGTGTTAVAAKTSGRRFIGSEIFKERYDLSVSRIGQEL